MSQANYIIICKGRIDFATAADTGAKIRALSDAATNLVSHIDIMSPGALSEADTKPISDLQHELMNHALTMSADQVRMHGVEMFNFLDAIEEKFDQTKIKARK